MAGLYHCPEGEVDRSLAATTRPREERGGAHFIPSRRRTRSAVGRHPLCC